MTCAMQTWVGAYVLDALEPDETETVRQHIAGCDQCRDDVAGLAWIPSLVRTVDLADVDEFETLPQAPPPVMLERLLQSIRPARPARRRRALRLLAAAAIVVAALSAVGMGLLGSHHQSSRPVAVSAVDPHTRVRAAVTMTAHRWGTELHLRLSWVKPGQQCSLVARSRDGRSDIAASWVATYQGTASVPGATAIPLNELSELDVVTVAGHQLVRIVVPNHTQ